MAQFWLATFDVDPPEKDAAVAPPSARAGELRRLAIEILHQDGEWGVLFSRADSLEAPRDLTCLMAFTNAAKACSVWRDRGFPLVDATIVEHDGHVAVDVASPFFRGESEMQYESQLFRLSGLTFDPAAGQPESNQTLSSRYCQELRAPDAAQPDLLIRRREITWEPPRQRVRELADSELQQIALDLGNPPARCPSLASMFGTLRPVRGWAGEIPALGSLNGHQGDMLAPVTTKDSFGVPAFRFEDVEVLGFRIDLGRFGRDVDDYLTEIIRPLNFHLSEEYGRWAAAARTPVPDFRYRVAAPMLLIELLRYGRMKATAPSPPLTVDDSQSQHELVVRLLVGRVDDDTAQASAPAVYVPAIFVDNPWSKVLGREMLGFDKRMADFSAFRDGGHARLLPDGRLPGPLAPHPATASQQRAGGPVPLGDISRISLVGTTGVAQGPPLLDLDLSSLIHLDPNALERIDLDLGFGSALLRGLRWRLTDFIDAHFRRWFARRAIPESLRTFRCIQPSPVADRGLLPSWITGAFVVDADVRATLPLGAATLTLHAIPPDPQAPAAPSAPDSWNLLCKMLGDDRTAQIRLPTGTCYRMVCSMDLKIDDGLTWRTR